jgi:hypothetical protein
MIFKTALKYKIWEWCLESLVNRFMSNFHIRPGTRRMEIPLITIKVGMHVDEIVGIRKDGIIFTHGDCLIKSLTKSRLGGSFIGFSYRQYRRSNYKENKSWIVSENSVPVTNWSVGEGSSNNGLFFYMYY